MVNNYTNINNYFRTPITEHKITTTYDAGNPDPCLGQTQTCGWVKLVNGTQCPLDNLISIGNTNVNKY